MAGDVELYCRQCNTCQESKLRSPIQAPLQNVSYWQPIGDASCGHFGGSNLSQESPLLTGYHGLLYQMG